VIVFVCILFSPYFNLRQVAATDGERITDTNHTLLLNKDNKNRIELQYDLRYFQ